MSRARTTGLSAGEAVLGLVIEHPDRGFDLERRLEERFGSARFAYSTAYNALYRMEKQGLVRIVGGDGGREAIYEATADGMEHFRRWVRTSTSAPVLREELHAKIALSEPRDLPRLIDVVRTEELACIAELGRIRDRMIDEQPRTAPGAVDDAEWSMLMHRGVLHGEAAFWGGRITQLGHLRSYLEELRAEAERRALEEHRPSSYEKRRTG
jgi:DNA-binding PadR family transcriptional regulator